jgi:hypothetical protein
MDKNLAEVPTITKHPNSPAAPNSPACPVAAFMTLQHTYPVLPTDLVLISYRVSGQLFIITQAHLCRALKRLVLTLNFPP